jgi:molybdopterin/thiamine biosynthesis adenylyltransferase
VCAVLGPAVGVISSIMALEVFRTALGRPRLAGRLLVVDLKHMSFEELKIEKSPNCPVCSFIK